MQWEFDCLCACAACKSGGTMCVRRCDLCGLKEHTTRRKPALLALFFVIRTMMSKRRYVLLVYASLSSINNNLRSRAVECAHAPPLVLESDQQDLSLPTGSDGLGTSEYLPRVEQSNRTVLGATLRKTDVTFASTPTLGYPYKATAASYNFTHNKATRFFSAGAFEHYS